MKCIVTGHTSGIGKSIYNHLQSKGWDVKGMSRSNGYNIVSDQEKIIAESLGCDIFVNCAYDGSAQLELLNLLDSKVKNIVVIGSVGADYASIWKEYGANKLQLEKRCKELSLTSPTNIFYIKLAFCENSQWPIEVDDKYKASFAEINQVLDTWLSIPRIYSVEFVLKETPAMINRIKE